MDSAAPLPRPQTAEEKCALQLSVQLIKRWRDRHYAANLDLAPVSIVLTTLMGNHYYGDQSVSSNLALSVERIIDSLPSYGRLIVLNPSHPQEELSERWRDPSKYQAFVSGLKTLRRKLIELGTSEDMGHQSSILQDLFGDGVTRAAFAEQGNSLEQFRASQRMGIARASSGTVNLAAVAAKSVQKNTFYGDF